MSFGNAAVFPFPAVQYIPMAVTTLARGSFLKKNPDLPPQLIVGDELFRWKKILEEYRIKLPEMFPAESFPILALHLNVREVKYRGYFVTMTGRRDPGGYHLCTLPKYYFYKNKLLFELYDETSGAKLAKYSLFMPR